MGIGGSDSSRPRLAWDRDTVEGDSDAPTPIGWSGGEETWGPALEALRGAYADVTIKEFCKSMRTFQHWCDEVGCVAVPATPATVVGFIEHCAQRLLPVSIQQHIYAIRRVHIVMYLPDPTYADEVVLARRRAKRLRFHRPRQALPITRDVRDRLLAQCGSDLRGLRDRALVSLGFDTLCRCSELVRLRIEDIEPESGGAGRVLVRRSKTDRYARGEWAYLSQAGMANVSAWLTAAGLTQGAVLRRFIWSHVQEGRLTAQIITKQVRELARRAGYSADEVRGFSSHSFRVGAVQEMAASGATLLEIMRAGRWRNSDAVSHYLRKLPLNPWEGLADGAD